MKRLTTSLLLALALSGCGKPDGFPQSATRLDVFDPGSFGAREAPPVAELPPVRVMDYGPRGKTTEPGSVGQIHVRFNQPLRPVTDATSQAADGLLAVSDERGPVPGRAYFKTPDLLVFEPDQALEPARRYSAELSNAVESADGRRLTEAMSWTFETDRPRVLSLEAWNGTDMVEPPEPLFLRTTLPTTADALRGRVALVANDQPVPFSFGQATKEEAEQFGELDGRIFRLVPAQPLPLEAVVSLSVEPGWRSSVGPLPADAAHSSSFHVHPPLRVNSVSCPEKEACPIHPVELNLSTPVPVAQRKHVRVRPAPPELKIESYDVDETMTFYIDGRFVPGTKYEISIDGRLEDVFGQKLGKTYKQTAQFEMPPAQLYLDRERGMVRDGKPHLGFSSRHVKKVRVRVAKVPLNKWMWASMGDGTDVGRQFSPIDQLGQVSERVVTVKPSGPTEWASTPLRLEEFVGDYRGPVAVELFAEETTKGWEDQVDRGEIGLYQFTSLAPLLFVSEIRDVLRVEDLDGGEPVGGATVSVYTNGQRLDAGDTSPDGLLDLNEIPAGPAFLVVQKDGETAILDFRRHRRGSATQWLRPGEEVTGRVVTERGAYQPGEAVFVTAWAAVHTPHDAYGIRSLPEGTQATITLYDAHGTALDHELVDVRHGKAWARLELPTSARLGSANVEVTYAYGDAAAKSPLGESIRIEEYRVPEFEVAAHAEKSELVGDEENTVDVTARYFSGGPLDIRSSRIRHGCWDISPPDVDGWQLGVPTEFWGHAMQVLPPPRPFDQGHLRVQIPGLADPEGHTRRCVVDVAIQSVAYQEEGSSATFLVHPASWYLGIRGAETSVPPGGNTTIELAAFDVAGQPVERDTTAHVTVTHVVEEPVYTRRGKRRWVTHWEEKRKPFTTCEVELASARAACELKRLERGTYEIDVRASGESSVRARAEVQVHGFAAPNEQRDYRPPIRLRVEPELAQPGEAVTAHIETSEERSGLLLVERFGIREALPFQTRGRSAKIELATSAAWAPKMKVSAWVVDRRQEIPRLDSDSREVRVAIDHRKLRVNVASPKSASIRSRIPVEVSVHDETGLLAKGRVTVWAVDEAVLGLTDYRVPDVGHEFLPKLVDDVLEINSLALVLPPFVRQKYDPYQELFGFGEGFGAGGLGVTGHGFGGGGAGKSAARSNFQTTPLFVGDAEVVDGVAKIEFDTPDNMTAFRIIAIASAPLHDETTPMRFGSGEATLAVTAPLIARPALPRFVRPGDSSELAVIVQNQTGKAGRLEVRLGIEGEALELVGEPVQTVEVDGSPRQTRVAFPAKVVAVGDTQVLVSTKLVPSDGSAAAEDAIRLPLQSRAEPTVVENVAVYGSLADDATVGIPVKPPESARSDYGGVQVTVTSTILGGLRDATRNLVHYPYGCVEQTASRMLPLVALSDLTHFVEAVELPNGSTIASFVGDGVARILSMQTGDGGFGYWPGATEASPYASAYATWILQLAAQAGHEVPEGAMNRALDYLQKVTATPDRAWPDDVLYYHDIRRAIAVHVLATAGRKPTQAITELYESRVHLPAFADAFVALAMHAVDPDDPRLIELRRELTNAVSEHAGTASVVEAIRYDLTSYFHSDLRSSAIVLMALSRIWPDGESVVVKLARGLMDARYRGAWRNTQENAYALVAIADYARKFEAETPAFSGRVWTDNAVLLEDRWEGRSSKERTGRLPMESLAALSARGGDGLVPINLSRVGAGRAYYRLGMTYALEGDDLPPIARGIDVRRTFRRQGTDPSEVVPATVPAGELMAIDVELETKSLTRYVAIDIPLPAGLEGVNLALGGPKVLPLGGAYGWWVSHSEFHDDRIVLFADTLHPGRHRHTVYVRATTPGDYVFPPTVAQAMYVPEIFGRTEGARISVR